MSTIAWSHAVVPEAGPPHEQVYETYDGRLRVARTRRFPAADEELVVLPDARALRSMSRAALLLAAAGLPAKEVVGALAAGDPFAVGTYCAIESGPHDYATARRMLDTPAEEFAATFRSLRYSQQYLRQLPSVAPARLQIFLGLLGPLYVYNHSTQACLHALEQAEEDLGQRRVRAAFVCAAFSLEDALVAARTRRRLGPRVVLSEGAACLLLVADDAATDWAALRPSESDDSYGIAHAIVTIAARRQAMMADREIFAQVENAVCKVLKTPPGTLRSESAFIADLGAESIDLIDIGCELEKALSIELSFRQVFKSRREKTGASHPDLTVQELVEYLSEQIAAPQPAAR